MPEYKKLVEYRRNNLVEQEHYGIILYMNKQGVIKKIGNDNNYPFYHRSCMKPMQAAPLIDLSLDKKYNFTLEEIAVCCASHTGDIEHQKYIQSLLKKSGYSESDLLCHPHTPLSLAEQARIIKNDLEATKIHNNCSGKHCAMLLICKELGFQINNYKDIENPLSDYIINKVCSLCEIDRKDVTISSDGCGLPVIATPLENLGKGFLNLFLDKKYEKIKEAFLKFPYLIGGNKRLDSELINATSNIIAKVGACGLCVVVNLDKKECIVVKIADSNMEARAFVVVNILLQLKWLSISQINTSHLKLIYEEKIYSQDLIELGEITPCFSLTQKS